jgi:hypothetical protein
MTLSVDSASISIKNSLGVVKFSSNDKLVYLKYSSIGTIDVGGSDVYAPFYATGSNEFLYLTLRFNSSNGNSVAELLGKFIPANGSIVTNFYGRGVNNVPSADTDYLCCGISGTSILFRGVKYAYDRQWYASTVTSNITYNARVYSYL